MHISIALKSGKFLTRGEKRTISIHPPTTESELGAKAVPASASGVWCRKMVLQAACTRGTSNPTATLILCPRHYELLDPCLLARPELSERERQVLEYIAYGRSNKEIGRILYISEHTVKTHVKSILTKLDAMGRTEAIAVGIKRGLIKPVS